MKKVVLIFAFLIKSYIVSLGQEVNELPILFQQFFNNYSLLNPAALGLNSRLELYVVDKSYMGEFRGVNKFGLNVNYGLQYDSALGKKIKHFLGITFYNDKIGSYIGRSRAYLSYCMHIPISSDWRLNAGTSFGIVNYYYRASTLFPGRSVIAPSGDIGLWLYGKKWNIGVAANQLFSGNVSPYNEVSKLTRFYNFSVDKKLSVNHYLHLKPAFWLLYVNTDYCDANLALLGIFQKLFSTGASYKINKGYTLYLGLEKITLGEMNLKWMASYYNRIGSSDSYEVQSVEISLLLEGNSCSKKSSIEDIPE